MADKGIDVLLEDQRSFPPPQLKKSVHMKSAQVFARAKKDPRGFWAAAARELEESFSKEVDASYGKRKKRGA